MPLMSGLLLGLKLANAVARPVANIIRLQKQEVLPCTVGGRPCLATPEDIVRWKYTANTDDPERVVRAQRAGAEMRRLLKPTVWDEVSALVDSEL